MGDAQQFSCRPCGQLTALPTCFDFAEPFRQHLAGPAEFQMCIRDSIKEKEVSTPRELLRKGLDDGSERLRTQLRDTAQHGQADEYGGCLLYTSRCV